MKRSKAYHARRGLGVLAAASLMASFAVGAIGAAPAAVSSTSAAASTTSAAADPAAAHGGTTGWGTGTLTEADLHALVSQMTLSEEIGMVHGEGDPPNSAAANASCAASAVGCVGEAGWIPGVARLGIPPLRMTDGPAGIRLRHVETAMPAPVGLAATFDRATAGQYGATVGLAGRATNQDVWLGPMINAVNYPTAGRNFETLGEDPYLASQLVAREVKGVQSTGLVAELKHYIENDFENGRGSTSVAIDDQTLHETELQAFAAGIAAGAGSLMCSYNRINNIYGCGNSDTLGEILRQQLAFTGFVQSDWGAIHKTTDLFYGADIEQPGNAAGTSNFGNALMTAVTNGTPAVDATSDFPAYPAISASQWKSALDTAVFHILTTMNKAGLLEGTQYGSHFTGTPAPYVPPRPDLASLQPSEFAAARAIAEESATLLKNDGGALPLSGADLYGKGHNSGVAVMGPTAIAPYVGGGGSAHVTPYDPAQGPYDALAAAAGRRANLTYVPGYDLDGQVVPSSAVSAPDPAANYPNWTLTAADAAFAGKPGLLRQQTTTDAVASGAQPVLYTGSDAPPDQLDTTVDYTGANTLPAGTAWRWSGLLTAPANPGGTGWQLKVFVKNQARAQLFIDGLTVGGAGNARRINIGAYPAAPSTSYAALAENARSHDPANETLQQGTYAITLSPGQQIHLDLRLVTGTAPAQIQLRWVPPDDQATSIAQAAAAAKNAHKVIVFAYDDGTEGRDRGISDQAAGLELPGYQDDLIQAVAAANPNTVVVLNSGDPVLMPWASSVKSVLEMWYPGQQGGQATAGVLLGRANPGGKLPVTFPADGTHFPTYDPNCTDTSVTGNCPLYPGVAGPSPFLTGTTTSYRTIIGMAVNGIFEGYRWYDQHNVAPLYPFGYGLSYTTFAYSRLRVSGSRDGGLDVSFRVTNTGDRAGSDVPQVYVGPSSQLPSGIQQAVRRLVQFQRVELGPGRSATLTLHVTPHDLSSWSSAQQKWVVGTGLRTVYAGPSSRDLPLQATVMVRAR